MDILERKKDYLRPLKEVSMDDTVGKAVIEAEDMVYKFDAITEYVCQNLRGGINNSSCDAVIPSGDDYYMVEFKNQKRAAIDQPGIRKKAFDSFQTFRLVMEQEWSVDETEKHLSLIVVFQEDPAEKSFEAIENKMAALAHVEKEIHFGLREIEGKLYREVYTIPAKEFCDVWYPKLFPAGGVVEGP